jgi:hypothetical protein
LKNVEYRPDETGTAAEVKCPLVDNWITPVDCMENQEIAPRIFQTDLSPRKTGATFVRPVHSETTKISSQMMNERRCGYPVNLDYDYDETITELDELVNHFLFEYNGKNCGIDPISKNEYHLWYGDHTEIVQSIDEVVHSQIWDGHTLCDIFRKITPI